MKALLPLLWGLLIALPVQADALHAPEAIRESVRQFVVEHYAATGSADPPRVEVGELDPRLRLPACPQPLETSFPGGSAQLGRMSVSVRCSGPKPWSLYVPVATRVYREVLVASRPLAQGTVLAAGDVHFEERDVTQATSGYHSNVEAIVGQQVNRAVAAGQVLGNQSISPARIVRRGERVTLLARGGGLEIRMQGTALADGAVGQRIGVRNLSSGKVVEGEITAERTVLVSL